jgi:anti-sigma B factor antagonist
MALEIVERKREGIVILDLKGDFTFGPGDLAFQNRFALLVDGGVTRLILNLGRVRVLDSTGLETLLFALVTLRSLGGRLAMFNMKPHHCEVLTQARLETVVEVFKDEHDAIDSFFADRKVEGYDILHFVKFQKLSSLGTTPLIRS